MADAEKLENSEYYCALYLTKYEARVLFELCYHIGGSDDGPRGIFTGRDGCVKDALGLVGIEQSRSPLVFCGTHSSCKSGKYCAQTVKEDSINLCDYGGLRRLNKV